MNSLAGSTHVLPSPDTKGYSPRVNILRSVGALLSGALFTGALLWADAPEDDLAHYITPDGNDAWSGR